MAGQFNAVIATQTVVFRGTSQVKVETANVQFPNMRALAGAAYVLNVTGGVSGAFGVVVMGQVGGYTVSLAGVTNISSVGNYVLYPFGYTTSGVGNLGGAGIPLEPRIDQIVPPYSVLFQGNSGTAGISATLTVSAAVQVPR